MNSALIAKIHTVEWTPAIIAHPTTKLGMNANWWGLMGERFTQRFGRLGRSEVLSGIPGSPTNHHAAPYSLTEEFVAVYRMHPLLPDDFTFRSLGDDRVTRGADVPRDRRAPDPRTGSRRWASRTRSTPSASRIRARSRCTTTRASSRRCSGPDGTMIDLAATDIMRIRERGVPRYNDFRELFHKQRVESFEELTRKNPETAEELGARSTGTSTTLDLMVGLYAEPLPQGFGFSDTAFRVFVLMASRRLKSDRFFTRDYRPEVYSPTGFRWVQDTTMSDVLLRHYPELEPALRGVDNAFAPWNHVA